MSDHSTKSSSYHRSYLPGFFQYGSGRIFRVVGELLVSTFKERFAQSFSDVDSGDPHWWFSGITGILAHLRDGVPVYRFLHLSVLKREGFMISHIDMMLIFFIPEITINMQKIMFLRKTTNRT